MNAAAPAGYPIQAKAINVATQPIRFNCVGCGDCCRGKHGYIPLTLNESKDWLRRGHRVSVLVEAVPAARRHQQPSTDSGVAARSGEMDIRVVPIFGADILSGCPNLGGNNACRIYDDRPLVCRIYPAETSPFTPFRPDMKACPPEAWNAPTGDVIADEVGLTSPAIQALVDTYRHLGRDGVPAMVAICEELGFNLASLKGNGVVIHTPAVQEFIYAIEIVSKRSELSTSMSWVLRVHGIRLAEALLDLKADLFTGAEGEKHVFIPLHSGREQVEPGVANTPTSTPTKSCG